MGNKVKKQASVSLSSVSVVVIESLIPLRISSFVCLSSLIYMFNISELTRNVIS